MWWQCPNTLNFMSLILYSLLFSICRYFIHAKCQKAFNLIFITWLLLHRSMFFVLQIKRRTLETKAPEDNSSDSGKFVVSKIWGLHWVFYHSDILILLPWLLSSLCHTTSSLSSLCSSTTSGSLLLHLVLLQLHLPLYLVRLLISVLNILIYLIWVPGLQIFRIFV